VTPKGVHDGDRRGIRPPARRTFKFLGVFLLAVSAAFPIFAGRKKEEERKEVEAWAQSLDRESVHKAVLEHEIEPLGKEALKIRAVLAVHFKRLDYIVCLDQIGSLLDKKNDVREAVFWQVVFGSGDFVEEHPEKARDKFAYLPAGLESGLRAYENALREKPKARVELLDQLLALRDQGRLMEFVKEHPCDD
jgi:hypothetical protein